MDYYGGVNMYRVLKTLKVVIPTIIFFSSEIPVYAQTPNLSNIYQNILSTKEVKEDVLVEQSFDLQLQRAKEGLAILLSDLEEDIKRGKDTAIRKKAISAQLKVIEAIESEAKKMRRSAKALSSIPLFRPAREKDISFEELQTTINQILTAPDIFKIQELKEKLPSRPQPSFPIYHKTDDIYLFEKGKIGDRRPAFLPRKEEWEEGVKTRGLPLFTPPEIQINEEIRNLAQSLNNDYQQIFNWVQRNIDFQPYLGCAKGSILTLWDKAGNAADINALFCALLQAAGYNTQYIDASITIPIEKAPDLAGLPDINDAYNILNQHGLIEKVIGSPTTHLIISHFYTAVNVNGKIIYLDPSFKDYEFTKGIKVPYQKFDEALYLSNEKSYLPVDRHEEDVKAWLKQNLPEAKIEDVFIKATISSQQLPQPPLPYEIYKVWGTYTAIPAWAMHKVRIKLVYWSPENKEIIIIPGRIYNLCSIAGKRVSLFSELYQDGYLPKIAVDGVVT